ncbi:MAG: serine/threonine protein kinase [Myxococcota bacterium]|nr:serine/threonine protein kinase [Myxococcota bacterium]
MHRTLRRRFAAKVLVRDLAANTEALARFHREVDAVARLQHPNVVQVVGFEVLPDGSPCMIMEYLEGEDLAARVERKGRLAWSEIGPLCHQIVSALDTAHRAGIVHRDLKPPNVFIARAGDSEQVKLLDFGIAKILDSKAPLTSPAQVIGTPQYMAPEQIAGDGSKIGPPTDIWALGAIMFEMATATPPFVADTIPMLLYKICHDSPPDLDLLRPDAPSGIRHLIRRCMDRDGAQRPTIRALRDAFDQMLTTTGGGARAAVAETDLSHAPVLRTPAPAKPTTLSSATGAKEPAPGRAVRWPLYAGVGVTIVIAGVFAVLALRGNAAGHGSAPRLVDAPLPEAAAKSPSPAILTLEIESEPSSANV